MSKIDTRLDVSPVPPDEIFALNGAYAVDPHPQKVSLGVGVYRTDDGKPWPLPVVQKAERELVVDDDLFRHEYTAIEGDVPFIGIARDLMFGFEGKQGEEEAKARIGSVQTVAGTGANHLGALFLARHMKPGTVWLSNPSWANHQTIWELAGVPRKTYPYYHAETRSFDFEGMMSSLESEAQEGDVVLLHACAHNPTGLDPNKEQWVAIADLCERKKLFPFFDSAYQGFASGSVEEDAWAVRYFFNNKPDMEICVAQSFSKNFGLYGQRVGAFHYCTNRASTTIRDVVVNNLCHLIRGEFSMGPRVGCSIVKKVLTSEELTADWHRDLQVMSSRIKAMRKALYSELVRLQTPGTWEHIIQQNGMFSYTGLSPKQVGALKDKYHIYLLNSGRASISGLSQTNVAYVAQAIDDVIRNEN
ncbi:Aspartate aminotransferase [Penicillium digitatum]|uniref:Aspartate aminotransferase n=3 Tax=Penicillium digitatum TaxID=36651 RepID=K9G1U6_PEND2|nr:Aspartate aminotransferase [Penicillium digitatum Pd1]EKV10048.1 Aspartate aminotransferase [Penicillium digitatum Pd1]EKV15304.1 Aspartate aminotransferase [Penicillium digitatum PHI26]QQK44369.1 Aspartate aminotransferase [Penicillium digitatum]